MADARARRHHLEIVERAAAPFQELIAFQIALIFARHIVLERLRRAELVDHHGVIDHQMHGHLRVDLLRIAAQRLDAIAHRGQIDHGGHAGEVLHQHARGAILDLMIAALFLLPVDHRLRVFLGNGRAAILEPQHVFQQHLQREGQAGYIAKACCLLQREEAVFLTVHGHRIAGIQAVLADLGHLWEAPVDHVNAGRRAHPLQRRANRYSLRIKRARWARVARHGPSRRTRCRKSSFGRRAKPCPMR